MLRQLLDTGEFGDVKVVTADFGADRTAPVFRPELGGGVLRDIGNYPVWFAPFVLGDQASMTERGSRIETGVDAQGAAILETVDGAQAILSATKLADTPVAATISGTRARAEVWSPFLMPDGFDFVTAAEHSTWPGDSGLRLREVLCWQAVAAAQHVADGLIESPIHSLDDSIAIMGILDSLREQA